MPESPELLRYIKRAKSQEPKTVALGRKKKSGIMGITMDEKIILPIKAEDHTNYLTAVSR